MLHQNLQIHWAVAQAPLINLPLTKLNKMINLEYFGGQTLVYNAFCPGFHNWLAPPPVKRNNYSRYQIKELYSGKKAKKQILKKVE